MTRDDWKRIKGIAAAALDLPPAGRASFIAQRCGMDTALHREVSTLVDAAAAAEELYETPSVLIAGATAALESLASFDGPRAGDRVGPYRLVRSLGRGGIGITCLAVRDDAGVEQRVAIKFLRRGTVVTAVLDRVRRERQRLADLDHPVIARLLDAGTTPQGLPYFVTDYGDGAPIDAFCRTRQLTTRERVHLFRRVCDAVGVAHSHGIVHRDLKPANILVAADGTPRLLDFGISTSLVLQPGDTIEPALFTHAMRLRYASPEMVRGGAISAASDVYSLGVLLFEVLAERRPFDLDGLTLDQIDRMVAEEMPRPPSAVAPAAARAGIARDLDDIVLMALRKEPHRRYASAGALSSDLLRWLEGKPVEARAGRSGYRLMRLVKRHRLRFVEAALVGAMVAAAAEAGPWWRPPAASEARAASPSLAVVPFDVAPGGADLAWVAEGLAAALGDSIARYSNVRVHPGRGAAGVTGRDLRAVARDLNVGALLLGEVTPSGGRLSIGLRLVDGATGQRLWTRHYDGRVSRLLMLRDGMTRDVLDGLAADTTAIPLSARETVDAAAYELYLKGRYASNTRTEDGLQRGVDSFRQAIARDPQFARAYAGLAACFTQLATRGVVASTEAMPRAEQAARSAIARDGTLAEAHTSLAVVQWAYHRDMEAAAAGFQRALALDPGSPAAHTWYAYYLASRRRFDEAIAAVERARALDPASPGIGTSVGEIYYWARRDEDARTALDAVLQVAPDFAMARNILGLVLLRAERMGEAVEQLEAAHRLGYSPQTLATLAYAYGIAGRADDAEAALAELMQMSDERYTSPLAFALAHLGAGGLDRALDALEQALVEHSDSTVVLGALPPFDRLRGQPRFDALLRRAGLDEPGAD